MSFRIPLVIPVRFLSAILHIVITSIILMYREWNLSECQQVKVTKGTDLYKIKDDQYIIALSFTIGLTGIELLSFMSGISVYSNVQSFISAFFHFVGFVATLFFMFYRTCTDYIWVIFGVCSFVPFFTEIVTALRICACKRLPPW